MGEFPIRNELNGTLAFLICKRCPKSILVLPVCCKSYKCAEQMLLCRCSQVPAVQGRLVHANLVIDLLSLTGKRLLRKGKKVPRKGQR